MNLNNACFWSADPGDIEVYGMTKVRQSLIRPNYQRRKFFLFAHSFINFNRDIRPKKGAELLRKILKIKNLKHAESEIYQCVIPRKDEMKSSNISF